MTRVVLAAAYRTPIGVFGGAFKDVPAYDLGATLIEHIIKETGLNQVRLMKLSSVTYYKQDKDKIQHELLL